jgi:sulfate-transporting ATPase
VSALLEARALAAGWGTLPVVHDLDVAVEPGEIVALLGANGAGKTTSLFTLGGLLPPLGGEIWWRGSPAKGALHDRCQDGLAFVTEERSVFMALTARENLRVGRCDVSYALALFPELEPHLDRRAGLLSGGQQQILTLARALARRPAVLLADELSLGLAPKVVGRLLSALRTAADDGLGVLLVEQHVRKALTVADRVMMMRRGHIEYQGSAAEALANIDAIEASYLSGDVPDDPAAAAPDDPAAAAPDDAAGAVGQRPGND